MTAASEELALPTVGEFLSAVGVTAAVVYPEHPGSPVVSLDIPYDWHEVIREVLPTAFGAWALPAEEDAPPEEAGWVDNAVLMVWRMSRPVDPVAVMRCAFTDSRRLPDWREHRTRSEDRDGFPSAAISGTYSFGELSLWSSTRYLMAGTPTGQYLLQLTVTTRAEDDRDGRFIAGSLGVQSPIMQPPPPAHALRSVPPAPPVHPEPPAAGAWPESAADVRPEPPVSPARPGPSTSDRRSEFPDPAGYSESAAGTWSEPVSGQSGAAAGAWSEPDLAGGSGSADGGVWSESLASAVQSEWSEASAGGVWVEPSGVDGWSGSAAHAWLEPDVEGRSESSAGGVWSGAAVRSESPVVDEWSEESESDEWLEDPDSDEWVEDSESDEWGEDSESDGWVEDSESDEWAELEEPGGETEPAAPVGWAGAPSVVVRAESVAGGAPAEPPPVVRDALLPVLGAEGGHEPEG